MIVKRELVDETGKTITQFAEIHEGDDFVDKYGDTYYISLSGEWEGALISKVLNGIADDENISVMMDDEIFAYFHNPHIVSLKCALEMRDFNFREWRFLDETRWVRFQDWRPHAAGISIFTDDGNVVEYLLDQPVKILPE